MFSVFAALVRPGRLLSGLTLFVVAVLMAPMWLLWPWLGKERRDDVLSMVDRLRGWVEAVVEPPGPVRPAVPAGRPRGSGPVRGADRLTPARSGDSPPRRQPARAGRPAARARQ